MRTTLSSPLTLLYKIGLLSLFAFLGLFLIAASLGYEWKKPGTSAHVSSSARVLYAMAGLTGFYWVWQCARLKRVKTDDNSLYVSNYRTEIQVPFTEIAGLRETGSYWFTIVITLKNPSRFGRTIVFRPRHRFYLSGLHPIARQLNELAEQAQREATGRDRENPSSKQPATATRPDITA